MDLISRFTESKIFHALDGALELLGEKKALKKFKKNLSCNF